MLDRLQNYALFAVGIAIQLLGWQSARWGYVALAVGGFLELVALIGGIMGWRTRNADKNAQQADGPTRPRTVMFRDENSTGIVDIGNVAVGVDAMHETKNCSDLVRINNTLIARKPEED